MTEIKNISILIALLLPFLRQRSAAHLRLT